MPAKAVRLADMLLEHYRLMARSGVWAAGRSY
jgi:hypothetical protein